MEEETKSSNTTMLHTAVEEESKNKVATTVEEKLKNVTPAEGEGELKKVKLKTSDEVIFEVEPCIAKEMEIVQSFIEDHGGENVVVPLPDVGSRELGRIIEYCSVHNRGTGDLEQFDKRFAAALSIEELMELLLAANHLNLTMAETIADMIKNKSLKFVSNFFGTFGNRMRHGVDDD